METQYLVEWNAEKDNPETFKNGWGLFQEDTGEFTIHGLDDPHNVCKEWEIECLRTFEGDNRDRDAAVFLQTEANKGDPVCRRGIEFLIERGSGDVKLFDLRKMW